MLSNAQARFAAGGLVLLALILLPAPFLPPHRLAEAVQSVLGVQWKVAYLAAAVGLQVVLYGALGLLAAYAVARARTVSGRALQIVILPLLTVGTALIVRSLKLGHLPPLANAAIPVVACLFGVWLGLGLLSRRRWVALLLLVPAVGGVLWVFLGTASAELSRHTEGQLQRLAIARQSLPPGDKRFVAVLQAVFATGSGDAVPASAVEHNRAAILALGLGIGDRRLARFVGLDRNSELVRAVFDGLKGTTLRGREDWPRHFCLSAALAVLEHPLVSDAGGLLKEQLDAVTGGSGFSFGDLAADRAGVRFAEAATYSEEAAKAIQARLTMGAEVDDLFPPAVGLPENLTVEQFRRNYGGVGSVRYQQAVRELEARLDGCVLLSPPGSSR